MQQLLIFDVFMRKSNHWQMCDYMIFLHSNYHSALASQTVSVCMLPPQFYKMTHEKKNVFPVQIFIIFKLNTKEIFQKEAAESSQTHSMQALIWDCESALLGYKGL